MRAAPALALCACQLVFPTQQSAPSPGGCGPTDGGSHDLADMACWSTYYVTTRLDSTPSYAGGSFDGRYAYFASAADGLVVRYDTSGPFDADSSWSSFSALSTVGAGIVFDGRYMYFVPSPPTGPGSVVRYDTKAEFEKASSWQSFDPNSAVPVRYWAGTFDGRYVYFAPFLTKGGTEASGKVERFDTHGDFGRASAWSSVDLTTFPVPHARDAKGFDGAVFDGRYVYLVPSDTLSGLVAARYDTRAAWGSTASWELFDLAEVDPGGNGFTGAMFDGSYVYFVPQWANLPALRFDPRAPFASGSSWQRHAPAPTEGAGDAVLWTGAFDGASLYYFPGTLGLDPQRPIYRHGAPAAAFGAGPSWESFDAKLLHGIYGASFGAAVFDGRYLYLAPALKGNSGQAAFARFDARDVAQPPSLPSHGGSFF